MSARRWAAASALALSGLGMGAWGTHLELDREADLEPAAGADLPVSVATPVMSARRVPALLVRPQASRRLNTAMAPLMAKAPAQRCVVVADGRSRVFADNPALPLPAASNQKLVTAFGAIERLGADATLATYVGAGAAPSDGVVAGDLWFIGGGDPLIDTEPYEATLKHGKPPRTPLEAIADRIVAAGVRTITGGVRGDESRYDRERVVASWPSRYIDQAQVGPLSALSVNDGRTYPAIAGAPAAPAKPAADPAAYAAQALHELLVARGVTIAAPPGSGSAPADLTHVVDVPSLAMSQIVAEMLTFSDNNTAELLVKELGHAAAGQGSTAAGLDAIRQSLGTANLPIDGLALADGSGLDLGNRVTCDLLDAILAADGTAGPISTGLAVANGDVGTLEDRYRGSPAAGKVRAKTGTLRNVSALSGWVRSDKGHDLSFAIVFNTGDRQVNAGDLELEENLTEALLSYPDAIDPATVAPHPVP